MSDEKKVRERKGGQGEIVRKAQDDRTPEFSRIPQGAVSEFM
jgi:hypothetical protein